MCMTSKIYAREILCKIMDDTRIIVATKRRKNADFMKKYGLTTKDVEFYIRSLKEKNFVEKKKNTNEKIKADYMYVFYKKFFLADEYGDNLEQVYIKICILNNLGNTIYVESFHDEYNF